MSDGRHYSVIIEIGFSFFYFCVPVSKQSRLSLARSTVSTYRDWPINLQVNSGDFVCPILWVDSLIMMLAID